MFMYPIKRYNSAIFHILPIKNTDILGKACFNQGRFNQHVEINHFTYGCGEGNILTGKENALSPARVLIWSYRWDFTMHITNRNQWFGPLGSIFHYNFKHLKVIFFHQVAKLFFLASRIDSSVFHFSTNNLLVDAFMRQQEICLPLQYPFNKKWTGIHQEYLVTSGGREIWLTCYFLMKVLRRSIFEMSSDFC